MPRMSADERYNHHGPDYHRLRGCQDLDTTFLPVLEKIVDLPGKEVVEMGAGTGPITLCLLPHVAFVSAYDLRRHMVETARANLSASGLINWKVDVGDHRSLPHPDHSVDLVIAGFTLGPMVTVERGRDWKGEIDKVIGEMRRVLRSSGTAVIIEVVWTGEEPDDGQIVHPWFRALVQYLEQVYRFHGERYRSDIDYSPLQEVPGIIEMIYGEEGIRRLRRKNWIEPECDGIWWKAAPL